MRVIIYGPQGSGKSTQAELLSKKFNIPHIATGDIYRLMAQEDSDLGRKIKNYLDRGELVDDQTTFATVDQYLGKIAGGFVLEGFPRTLTQAQREVFWVDKVFYLRLFDREATKRLLLRGRADDTPELIAQRLKLYHLDTAPILKYYKNQGKLVEIDGSGTIAQVAGLINKSLEK